MRLRLFPLVCVCAMVATLAACASTGGLHSTATPLAPASLHVQKSLSGVTLGAAAWPQQGWWKAAGDPQLDKLVTEALADNPDMTLVNARVSAALAAAGAANAKRKPTLNASGQISGARVPPLLPPLANGHFGRIRLGYLSFKWDLDLWGGKRDAWEAAVGKARAVEVGAVNARLTLSTDVVQAYFGLAGAYILRHLATEELQRAQDFRKLTKKRVSSGIENRLPLEQINSEVAVDRAHLEAADNVVKTSGMMLAALLGAGPDRALSIKRPTLPAIPALALPSKLPVNLLGRRPDVVAARWRVEATGKSIKAAKTKFLPNVSISALAGLIAPSMLNFFSLQNRFYLLGPAVNLPIFEGGALRANLAGKDAARDIAVAQYNQTLVQAIKQVATRADNMRSLTAQIHNTEQAHTSAQDAYKLALVRFRAGIGNFLEALTARKQLLATERQVAQLKLNRSDAWALLNEALGGGFKPAADAPSLAANHDSESKSEAHR